MQESPVRTPAHIIVVGNEKGGAGKSTIAMHLIVALMQLGARTGSIDLDARQATLTRYLENRRNNPLKLACPDHVAISSTSDHNTDRTIFYDTLSDLSHKVDILVIDTPGSDTPLSRLAHSFADTIITPLNDSFIDLDVLARVDRQTMKISQPGLYSAMVWDSRKIRAQRGVQNGGSWFVLRNRLSYLDAINKREMERLLQELSSRIGFRFLEGLNERVIFRELFLDGQTLLDLGSGNPMEISLSHVAARQELRRLIENLSLTKIIAESRSL